MTYLDKINVKGTEYDIQDSKAARQTEVDELKSVIEQIDGITDSVKSALLLCFRNVAWTNNDQNYYSVLETALYADDYPRITATFTPGTHVVYADDTLQTLIPYLTVKYYETSASSGVVLGNNEYTLQGTLTEGTSIISVLYESLSTHFEVSNVIDFYNIHDWSISSGNLNYSHHTVDQGNNDTTKYPSRLVCNTSTNRRMISVLKGKSPMYIYNETGVASAYYPIPIPNDANHIKITMDPSSQYFSVRTCVLNESNGQYANNIGENTKEWVTPGSSGYEWDITNPGNLYAVIKTKHDNTGTTYPTELSNFTIAFSHV